MKVILCPDSYKNNISSIELCKIMQKAIHDISPAANIISIPIADGGEGTLEAFNLALNYEQSLGTHNHKNFKKNSLNSPIVNSKQNTIELSQYRLITVNTVDPFFNKINAKYLFDGECAIIESAKAIGIDLVKENKDVKNTSTYGLGLLIKHALDNGAKEIILALGGSSTNDLGVGMASAIGYEFLDSNKKAFIPTAKNLGKVKYFNKDNAHEKIAKTKFIAMVDCKNPLTGSEGATKTYAKQKGAKEDELEMLEQNMQELAKLLASTYGSEYISLPGAGAAGGLGAASKIFLNADLQSGIDTLLDLISFNEMLTNADVVFTGEGRFDYQSLMGKAISGIAKRTKQAHVPLIVIAGHTEIEDKIDKIKELGIYVAYSINESELSKIEKIARSKEDVYITTQKAFKQFASKNS